MTTQPALCQPARAAEYLRGALNDADRAAYERHLDACAVCREALDAAAADPRDWDELRSSLTADASAITLPGDDGDERGKAELEFCKGWLAPTDDPRMLGRLGCYEIAGVLGRGGMGIVLKGFDPSLNRYVAIKVLAPVLSATGASRQRFLREAQSAAAVVHEHVVAIHGISQWQETPYLVMEYVRGESLQKRLAARGCLPLKEILRIGLQMASGLAAAHAQGLIHRDVKPANVLLETDIDRVRITDFGLARAIDDIRLTRTDMLLGTPQYMSPEQARDEALDFRTDLFSLGVVLYEASTARAPFQAATSFGTIRKIVEHEPKPLRQLNPDLPEWFERIVQRLMAKEPNQRYQTAAEVADLLRQCLAHAEQPQLVPLPAALRPKQGRDSWKWRIAMSVGLISVLVAGGWFLVANQMGSGSGGVGPRPAAQQPAEGNKKQAVAAVGASIVDGYTIKVGKVADVSGLKMDVAFDIGQLGVQQQTQGFGNAGGNSFAGGAGGGGGGRFNKPSLGIALIVEPPSGKENVLAEISPVASAVDDQGRTLKTEQTGPARIHFQEFERSVPGGQPIYFPGAAKDIKTIQKLEGQLLLSPGRVLTATFEGGKFKERTTKRVSGLSFVLESVTQNAEGIQVSVVCPPTKAAADATNPQERFQAMMSARGVYSAEIEDNTGEIHRSQSGNSAGGGGGFGGGGIGVGGPPPRGGAPAAIGSSQTFRFAPLPEGRQITTIRVRMTERTGPAKAVPFTIENIAVRADQ